MKRLLVAFLLCASSVFAGGPVPTVATQNDITVAVSNASATVVMASATTQVKVHYKIISGTTAGTQGASVSVAHGLTGTKIISVTTTVHVALGYGVSENHTINPGMQFQSYYQDAIIIIQNIAANSGNILSMPFTTVIACAE